MRFFTLRDQLNYSQSTGEAYRVKRRFTKYATIIVSRIFEGDLLKLLMRDASVPRAQTVFINPKAFTISSYTDLQ